MILANSLFLLLLLPGAGLTGVLLLKVLIAGPVYVLSPLIGDSLGDAGA